MDKIEKAKQLGPTEIFLDPTSPEEELAMETLRYKINHPFTKEPVFHREVRKPIVHISPQEAAEIGEAALAAQRLMDKTRTPSDNRAENT